MTAIRVLVVDDSATVRARLLEALSVGDEFVVIGEVADGRAAIEACARLRPDVVSLDMVMPVMTGLEATEHIMAHTPVPILIVSASMNRGELHDTFDALAAGAVDVLDKPGSDDERWDARYRSALRLVSRIKVITHPRAKLAARTPRSPVAPPPPVKPGAGAFDLVAIGASTGGPQAFMQILPAFPATFPVPILVVVHLSQPFDRPFVDWLSTLGPLNARRAHHGEVLARRGEIIVAPADTHLVVDRGALTLTTAPERHSCRPSVDTLFESVASAYGARAIGCLLSGMGVDGAAGLGAIANAGGVTIAQDAASSVVFGMPAEAIKRGHAQHVVASSQVARLLTELVASRKGKAP